MSQKQNHYPYLHAFVSIPTVGSETLKALEEHFGSLEAAWSASDAAIESLLEISPAKKKDILLARKKIDPTEEWEKFLTTDTQLFTREDPQYPSLLREIPDAPYHLYARGTFNWSETAPRIAIVGSRKFTKYGEQAAYQLAYDLTRAGFVVVSGLAFGIDAFSHKGALEAGGETLAVMGNGTEETVLYPKNHIPLAHRIMEHGAILSEYSPRTEANRWTFPLRNRIVAGMTLGTIVIEAAEKSGSLITADLALQYNREVFAVPGSIFSPTSQGTNTLIKRGAKIVTSVSDIIEEFQAFLPEKNMEKKEQETFVENLSPEETQLLQALTHEPLHIDKIIKITKLQTAHASSLLSVLEIKGLAKDIGGMHYIRL